MMNHNAVDRQQMLDVIARYAWGYDTADFGMVADAFTEDATSGGAVTGTEVRWGPMQGRAEIVRVLENIRKAQPDQRRHNLTTFLFDDQTATSAKMRCYLDLVSTQSGKSQIVTGGMYFIDFVRDQDVWRMKRLDGVLDGPF